MPTGSTFTTSGPASVAQHPHNGVVAGHHGVEHGHGLADGYWAVGADPLSQVEGGVEGAARLGEPVDEPQGV
jgi:hypothetical protein